MARWVGMLLLLPLLASSAAAQTDGDDTCSGAGAKQVLSTLTGVMSMCGSAFIVHQFHQRYHLKTLLNIGGSGGQQDASSKHADIAAKLVAWLSATDFFSSFFFCLGGAMLTKGVEETRASFGCTLQGWMIQFLGLSTITLTTAIAVNLYLLVVKGKSLRTLQKYEKNYLLACYGPTFFVACLLLIPNSRVLHDDLAVEHQTSSTRTSYGPAGTWCWVEEKTVGLVVFYLPLLLCWLTTFYIVFIGVPQELEARSGKGRRTSQRSLHALEASEEAIKTLRSYGGVFFAIWFWGLLNRTVGAIWGDSCGSPLFFQLMHAFFLPFQGFLNACVYSGLHIRVANHFGIWLDDGTGEGDRAGTGLSLSAQDGPGGSALGTCRTARKLSLFVGTWNMGEAAAGSDDALATWIEEGHDLYCVGVQECLTVDDVEASVARILAARSGKDDEWQSWKHSIGSEHTEVGFHGFIAIVVFVRKSEIDSGNFEPTGRAEGTKGGQLATGKNVGGKKLANKGAVGCSFRWCDTTIAFANSHLASDAGDGTSKAEKRNEDALTILRYLKIDMEDVEVDWPLLHHQAFFLGDLNYRIRMPPEEAIEATVSAVQASDWAALHSADELMAEMKADRVFSGFEEADGGPKFPPTYRRVRDASPGDYSDVEHVKSCYTLSVPRGADGATAPRTPSWCDRVLLNTTEGQAGKIRCTSYRLCDTLLPSDHVPVTATYELTVDADHPRFSTRDGITAVAGQIRATLLLSELAMDSPDGPGTQALRVVSPASYTTIFPLPAEDPNGQSAKLTELGGALAAGGASTTRLVDRVQSLRVSGDAAGAGGGDKSALHRVRMELPQEAWLAAKMHVGIKAMGANQSSLAQGVLPLADVIVAAVGAGSDSEAAAIRFDLPMSLGGVPVAKLRGVASIIFGDAAGDGGGAKEAGEEEGTPARTQQP
jgi:hypothetical protein